MKNIFKSFLAMVVSAAILYSCKETMDNTQITSFKKYNNIEVGKFITYRLDSIVATDFGQQFVARSYMVKDSIAEKFTDGEGNEAYKVYRLQQSNSGAWFPTNTFVVTPKTNALEYTENNLRYIKMVNPVNEFTGWFGNNYIVNSPYYPGHQFDNWRYNYKDIGAAKSFGSLNFANTVTVVQQDSTSNNITYQQLMSNPSMRFQSWFYQHSYETYAENVGLVYRDAFVWNYQYSTRLTNCKFIKPNATGGFDTTAVDCQNVAYNCDSLRMVPNAMVKCDTALTGYHFDGYGLKQTIVDHN